MVVCSLACYPLLPWLYRVRVRFSMLQIWSPLIGWCELEAWLIKLFLSLNSLQDVLVNSVLYTANAYVVSIVPPPPRDVPPVIAAEGENITLSCPLQTAPGLERFYTVEWQYQPGDMCIVQCGSQPDEPWASFNNETLALTVGPYDFDLLPSEFQCVSLSFQREFMPTLIIALVTTGNVQVIISSKFLHRKHDTACVCVYMQDTYHSCPCG